MKEKWTFLAPRDMLTMDVELMKKKKPKQKAVIVS